MGAHPGLVRAAAALVVLSLLPFAWVVRAPASSAGSVGDRSVNVVPEGTPALTSSSSPLFDSFDYDSGQVLGRYVQFAYDAKNGTIKSVLGLAGEAPVLYVGSISIPAFAPSRGETTSGSTFAAQGYFVTVTAHDDPTVLIEVRTDMPRSVAIELPATATNVSLLAAAGSWPASTVSYTVGEEHGRFLLGAGTFSVSGTRLVAQMKDSDLLVFKSVPPLTTNRAEWRLVLDAITAGRIVAELDLIATSGGQWMENVMRYRMGLSAWALAVRPGEVAVQVDSLLPGGAVVLLAFDTATMPIPASRRLVVRANGFEVNRTADALNLLFSSEPRRGGPRYTILDLPGTVIAVHLPTLAAISLDVLSVPTPGPPSGFDAGSELAMIAALALVCAAAARMLRRRPD